MRMARHLAGLTCLLSVAAALPAHADVQMEIDLSVDRDGVYIPYDGGRIRIQATRPKGAMQWPSTIDVDMPDHGSSWARIGHLRDNLPWVNYGQWVGITRLQQSDSAPSILFEAYTGGAHCCSVLVVLTSVDGKLKSIAFRNAEGEVRGELPIDIDGDDVLDIVRESELFCKMGECSHRTAIYNVSAGQAFDVTADPKFADFLAARHAARQEDKE